MCQFGRFKVTFLKLLLFVERHNYIFSVYIDVYCQFLCVFMYIFYVYIELVDVEKLKYVY